jgi:hypothetical protein
MLRCVFCQGCVGPKKLVPLAKICFKSCVRVTSGESTDVYLFKFIFPFFREIGRALVL